MSIFKVKDGKLEAIAIIKNGQTVAFADFMAQANPAPAAAAAETAKDAPKAAAEPAKEAAKK